jgi:hypothetical protein
VPDVLPQEAKGSHGASAHATGCACVRCRGFGAANEAALTHGSYSVLKLGDRAQEIADLVRPLLPVPGAAYEGTLQQYAITLVRIERASAALDDTEAMIAEKGIHHATTYAKRGDELMSRLRTDLRAWIRLSVTLASELGLTPGAQGRLLRDTGIGRAAHAQAALDALNDHIRRTYGRGEVEA